MKTILVPTDLSVAAKNAIDYAVEIARHANAKLILFNVFNVPVVPTEIPLALPIDEAEKESMDNLNKIAAEIKQKFGDQIEIECENKCGYPVEEIGEFASDNKIDLIVMGMKGTDYLTEKLIGSITTSMIKTLKYPVLVIDKNVKFRPIKRIVLATDYTTIPDKSILSLLKTIADLFQSHIYILNVIQNSDTMPTVSGAIEGMKLDHFFGDVQHSFHVEVNKNIVEGLNTFVQANQIDLLAMIPHESSLFKSMFKGSNTKKMAFHSNVALLTLHS